MAQPNTDLRKQTLMKNANKKKNSSIELVASDEEISFLNHSSLSLDSPQKTMLILACLMVHCRRSAMMITPLITCLAHQMYLQAVHLRVHQVVHLMVHQVAMMITALITCLAHQMYLQAAVHLRLHLRGLQLALLGRPTITQARLMILQDLIASPTARCTALTMYMNHPSHLQAIPGYLLQECKEMLMNLILTYQKPRN